MNRSAPNSTAASAIALPRSPHQRPIRRMWCCRTALTLGNVHLGRHVALHAEHGADSTLGHSRIGECLCRLIHAVLRDLLDLDAGQRS